MRPEFDWRDHNQIRLLVDGDCFFEAMLEAIDQASASVLMEMYLVTSGALLQRFVRALSAAAARGVQVCLLFDHFGSRHLAQEDRTRLTAAGAVWCSTTRFRCANGRAISPGTTANC